MVHNLVTGKFEDAADRDLDQIDQWLGRYDQAMTATRRDYNADYNELLKLRPTDRIQDQVQQRADPEGYAFDQNKATFVRDPQRIAAANAAIDAFAGQNYANPALDFD